MGEKIKCGIADVPCKEIGEDSLEIGNYVKGLEQFILNCATPMSIALQGDWGTGKTSFLRSMQNDFDALKDDKQNKENKENKVNIKTVYFNTWQYSQFKMSENLYASFISNIVTELGNDEKDSETKEKIKALASNVMKISSRLAKNIVKETTSIDIDELEGEIAKKELEKAANICKLKNDFETIVKKVKGDNGRVVIFVDDLDRLNPEIAVELLEVMKLFMDVEDCIFVLAIDYEVVVNGVRKKFGSDMPEDKCRSFFDKIIQLPFSMPVASYNIQKMIEKILGGAIKEYVEPISKLIKRSLGANPRTLKRLANSFFLLQMVDKNTNSQAEDAKDEELRSALLFASLVVQMYSYEAYAYLSENIENLKNILKEIDEVEGKASEENALDDEKANDMIVLLKSTLDEIAEMSNNKPEEIYRKFVGAINISSITNIVKVGDKESVERKKAMKVTKVMINGTEYSVKNPTYAQIKTYEEIIKINEDKLEAFMEKYPRILTWESRTDGFFRASKATCIKKNGNTLYIGTSSSSADKLTFTKAICSFMELQPGSVKWYDGDEEVFSY